MSARTFQVFSNKRRFGSVTIDKSDAFEINVILYNTQVVSYNTITNRVVLNTGGWDTVSTRACINEALRQLRLDLRVFKNKGELMIKSNSGEYQFEDNIKLDRDGICYV